MKRGGKEVSVKHPIIQKRINKSLKLSVREGSAASVSTSLGMSYFSPFALAMSATSSQIGILHALASLLPSLVQIKASKLIEKYSRKKIVLWGLVAQILLWVPIVLAGILHYLGVPYMVWALVGLIGLFYVSSALAHPAWFSWMGSLVPEDERGRYFSRRNRAAGFFGLVSMVLGAIILDYAKELGSIAGNILGYTLLGFGILFAIAAISRIWSWTLLARQYEPRLKIRKKDYFSFWQFLKKAPETPFGRFAIFRSVFGIAVGIASPFWAVYMLRDLGFSYIWFVAITVSVTVFQLMFLPLLGKFSDRFGNARLMKVSATLIIFTPLLWLASTLIGSDIGVKIYLLFAPAIVEGFAWAGFNLATNNYVYDSVSQPKQGFGLSYMNLLVGLGAFVGAGIGSLIALMNIQFMNVLLFIFLVSAIGRLVVAYVGLGQLREVRHVKKFSSSFLIKEFHPVQGIVREVHHLNPFESKDRHHI